MARKQEAKVHIEQGEAKLRVLIDRSLSFARSVAVGGAL